MYNSFLCILLIYTEKRLGVLENYAGILPKTSRRFFIFCTKEKNFCTNSFERLQRIFPNLPYASLRLRSCNMMATIATTASIPNAAKAMASVICSDLGSKTKRIVCFPAGTFIARRM